MPAGGLCKQDLEELSMPEHRQWDAVRELNRRVTEQGEPFSLTDETRTLLQATARDVAITPEEVARALQNNASGAELLKAIANRIRTGSRRLSRAIVESDKRQQVGDAEGARKPLLDVLAVEVVPHYREVAQTHLDALDDTD
jgi:DUSAM domain-containing protein